MSKDPQYAVAPIPADGTWRVHGQGIWGEITLETFTFPDEYSAQIAANTLNSAYLNGYHRAQYDIRKALGAES